MEGVPGGQAAGGEAGQQQALEVLGGGGELTRERGEEGVVAGDAAGDQREEGGQYRPDARREFEGVGVGRRCGRGRHDFII
jgi:hypothetical protein